jgi:hypothetical protein
MSSYEATIGFAYKTLNISYYLNVYSNLNIPQNRPKVFILKAEKRLWAKQEEVSMWKPMKPVKHKCAGLKQIIEGHTCRKTPASEGARYCDECWLKLEAATADYKPTKEEIDRLNAVHYQMHFID